MKKTQDKNIILNYQIKGEKIVINFDKSKFGDRKFVIDKTKENERILLNKMVEQTKSFDEEKLRKEYNSFNTSSGMMAIGATFTTIASILMTITYFASPVIITLIPIYIAAGFFTTYLVREIAKLIRCEKKLKSVIYLKNEEKINDAIADNENILASAPKKVAKIANKVVDKPSFDINTINQLSYAELIKLLEVIKTNEEFGFEHMPSKQKTLVKDLNK